MVRRPSAIRQTLSRLERIRSVGRTADDYHGRLPELTCAGPVPREHAQEVPLLGRVARDLLETFGGELGMGLVIQAHDRLGLVSRHRGRFAHGADEHRQGPRVHRRRSGDGGGDVEGPFDYSGVDERQLQPPM
jgi:hypothetical protein